MRTQAVIQISGPELQCSAPPPAHARTLERAQVPAGGQLRRGEQVVSGVTRWTVVYVSALTSTDFPWTHDTADRRNKTCKYFQNNSYGYGVGPSPVDGWIGCAKNMKFYCLPASGTCTQRYP